LELELELGSGSALESDRCGGVDFPPAPCQRTERLLTPPGPVVFSEFGCQGSMPRRAAADLSKIAHKAATARGMMSFVADPD